MALALTSSFRRRDFFFPPPFPTKTPISSFFTQLLNLSSSSSSSSSSSIPHTPTVNLSSLLHHKCQTITQLFQLQSHFITSGLFYQKHDPFPASRILKLSSHFPFNNMDYTLLIFRQIQSPDAFCINTVLKAYSHFSTHPNQAILFYFDVLRNGFLPNSFTFPPLLICCSKLDSSAHGRKSHAQAIKHGVDSVVPVQNALIHMYGSFGLIDSARSLFDKMSDRRDIVSWNSVVHAYVQVDDLSVAHCLFDQMPMKNVISWNIVMSGYLKGRKPGCVLKLFREMMKIMGFRGSSDTTIVNVLTACGRSARLKEGRSVHGSLIKNILHRNASLIVDTALIDMYSKCQRVEVARIVFDRMLVGKNLVCWNAMVLGYCIHGSSQDGISLFTTMIRTSEVSEEQEVLVPDEVTFVGVLCACARSGMLTEGRKYFEEMSSVYGITPTFAHYWCMANLYYGAGLVQEAEEVLRSMPEHDDGSSSESMVLSSLLGSCRFRGESNLGERIALRLIELEPQNVSRYNLLLNVYAVAGRWEEVGRVKELMKLKGIKESPGCSLLDLNEVVHEFAVGDQSLPGMEEVSATMDELAQELRLPPIKGRPMGNKS